MPTSSLAPGRGRPRSAVDTSITSSTNTAGNGWKYAGVAPGWKPSSASHAEADPNHHPNEALRRRQRGVNGGRFDHVKSSGYARVRPKVTAADIYAELDAARKELRRHTSVAEHAVARIALLEETHQSTTREFHTKRVALETGIANTLARLDQTRVVVQTRAVDVDVARVRLERLREAVATLEGARAAEQDAIASARLDFDARAEELAAIETQFEGRNRRLTDAVDSEKLKQEELMRQLVKVRTALEEEAERHRAAKNISHGVTAAPGPSSAATDGEGTIASEPVRHDTSHSAELAPAVYVLHPDMPMPPPGRRRGGSFSGGGAVDDDGTFGDAFGWLSVDDLILVGEAGDVSEGGAREGGEVRAGGRGGGGRVLVGTELEHAREVHDSVAAVLCGPKNEELHLWDVFQHYCTVGMRTARAVTDRGMSMSMEQFSRFVADCVDRAKSAAGKRGASSTYSAAHLAAYESLKAPPPTDVALMFTGILAQEHARRRQKEEAAAVGGGSRAGRTGTEPLNLNGGGVSSPRDAMAGFEQFLSGVVRLASWIRLPSLTPRGGDPGGVSSASSAYRRLASGATLHAGLPAVVNDFLRGLVFPFARTAGEELVRAQETARRGVLPRPTLRVAERAHEESDDDGDDADADERW